MLRRTLITVVLVLLAVAALDVRNSSALPGAPPGIDPDTWRPLSADVGIAIRVDRVPGNKGPMIGTLMARDGNRWRVVELAPGAPGAVPAQ